MPDHFHALPAGYKLNEYRIERVLGSGGFGITYCAWDENLNKPVAIKEYLPDFAVRAEGASVRPKSGGDSGDYQWGLERFLDEAQTLARFAHPHLNQVHRFFEAHGTAYLVLDCIDGETLGQMLYREGRLSEAPLRRLLGELLSGLEEVHRAGYVHRDVKPGNIMLRADGSAVLLDFGAARQAIGAKSKPITAILTPGYAPSEQYDQNADDVGAWSDIYALGMVAYRCVSGIGESGLIDAVTRSRFERKGELEKDIKPAVVVGKGRYADALLTAIDWAIKVYETERPQSVAAMQAAIESGVAGGAESGQAVVNPPGKPLEKSAKPAMSTTPQPETTKAKPDHTAKFVLAAVVIAAAVAGGLWWQQSQKEAALFTAELSYWNGVDCGDKAEVKKYLTKYPVGEYRQAAGDCIAAVDAEVVRVAEAKRVAEAERKAEAKKRLAEAKSKCTRHFNDDQYTQALPWCLKAANQGDVGAQSALGWMYDKGRGVTQDYAEAVKWYRKAAEQGLAVAQNNLGWMYKNGEGVTENHAEAIKWFRKAAEQGYAIAQSWLGYMYYNGQGVTKDDAEAIKWYRKAAGQGNAYAQYNLGNMYQNGKGVTQSKSEARKWYEKAAAQGDERAKENLENL